MHGYTNISSHVVQISHNITVNPVSEKNYYLKTFIKGRDSSCRGLVCLAQVQLTWLSGLAVGHFDENLLACVCVFQ